jgi:hypothetical protein
VEIDRVLFGLPVALAFFGDDMQENRLVHLFYVFYDIDQMVEIVAIDWAEIFEIERFKEHPRRYEGFE